MSGLAIREVHKSFGAHPVVRGLSLEIARGEIVSLLGPSGCGKTTALRMVAGLERPDGGTIAISGKTVWSASTDLPPERRAVGMVFQSYAVWPHRSVRENVAYPLLLKKDPNAARAADEALALVRLEGLADRYPETLSGGQQQRVALARALVARPELLLFDEPLSNLDAKLREDMRLEIRELVRRVGITSLYVTHDQPEAFAVSDRVAVILEGRIAQLAAPEELYRSPDDVRVAAFVGRLNVLAGARRVKDGSVALGDCVIPASFAPGAKDALVLGVRPEDIEIASEGAGTLDARVSRATFLGDRVELWAETPHGLLRIEIHPDRRLSPGETLHLAIKSCRAFPATE